MCRRAVPLRVLLLAVALAGVVAEPLLGLCHHDDHVHHGHYGLGDGDRHHGSDAAGAPAAPRGHEPDAAELARDTPGSFAAAALRPAASPPPAGPAVGALAVPERPAAAEQADHLACATLIVQAVAPLAPDAVAALADARSASGPPRPALDPATLPP